jgi:hypothetical protein
MSEVVHADIFFFVTTVAIVLITAAVLVVLYFCVLILRDVRALCAKVRKAGDELERDFEVLRANVKTEGVKLRTIVDMVIGFVTYKFRAPGKRKKPQPESEAADAE